MFALPASPVLAAPHGAAGSAALETGAGGALPAADTLWHDIYHVLARQDNGGGEQTQLWKGYRTDNAIEVMLRVTPGSKGDARTEAFNRLRSVESAHLLKAHEIHFEGPSRIEVVSAPHGVSLDVWRSGRPTVTVAEIESIVRQLSEALGSLHASGLAHLGIQPSVIFIQEEKHGLECTLGGLESVVRFEGDKLISVAGNPLYAPPEAAALTQHEPGAGICPWDWWGVGRAIQELILSHHIIDELPGSEASQTEQMRRNRAEDLLLELDPKGPRAGAVELMKVEDRLTTLLRGLLASSPEGRWGTEFVDRWLQNKSVKENYSDKRMEHKFRWNGRLWTVPEAAKELQLAERWSEAAAHVFKTGMPGMLAHYIANTPDQHLVHKQLGDLTKLATGEPFKSLPPDITRDLVLMLALLLMGGQGFIWRGRHISGDVLHDLLDEAPGSADRYLFVRMLTNAQVTSLVGKYDVPSSRTLGTMAQVAADAEAMIRKQGWLKGKNEKQEEEAIFRLAVGAEAPLTEAYGRLKRDFASASDAVMTAILKKEKPTRTELVVAAWVEPKAPTLGMVTHQEMKNRRVKELGDKCRQVISLLFWLKLAKPLRLGPLAYGSRWLLLATWLALGPVLAIHVPGLLGVFLALVPLVLIAGLRFGLHQIMGKQIKLFSSETKIWAWWQEPQARVRAAAAAVAAQQALPDNLAESTALLAKLAKERAELAKPDPLEPLPVVARHLPVWGVALTSWVLLAGLVGGSIAWGLHRPPSLTGHRKYWKDLFTSNELEKPKPRPEDQLITWPYKVPLETPFEIITLGQFTPTAAQTRTSIERARVQCKGYKPETIHSLIAIYTPLDSSGTKGGLLLYDGSKGAFLGQNGVLINFVPVPKMWMQIGDKRALFIEK